FQGFRTAVLVAVNLASCAPPGQAVIVAAGRYDGYWERGNKPWDVAAGILIVREAGGFVEGIGEGDDALETGRMIAANPQIFQPFAKVIRSRD
ncbi:MAG TPA: hypothetical protein EYO87_14250, partial [Paracoccus sp.]|nr:hypothetical protein [Paracoccus sp. (in: a-proteobacteria)]